MSRIIKLNGVYDFELPDEPQLEKDILFANLPTKDQYWRRTGLPENWKDLSPSKRDKFIEQEVIRSFVTGVHFANNGNLVWMPPDAYHYFNWWKMKDGNYPKFRMSQLEEYYFERLAESFLKCIGTFRFKKRRDGLTTRRMQRKVWKAIQPVNSNKWFGLQSKTGKDASDVCWETLMAGWRGMPVFMKPEQSGSSDPKKKLELRKPAQRLTRSNSMTIFEDDDSGLNNILDWRDTTADAYDGQELFELSLDEAAKWEKADMLRAFFTYVKCVYKDGLKVGHIHAFSSPAQRNGKAHENSIQLWNLADPETAFLSKAWFILRYFVSALDGYGEACDIYGICNRDLAETMILDEINQAPLDMRGEVKRQLPITIDDVLNGTDDMVFGSSAEMKERKVYLLGAHYKDEAKTVPKYVYGNLVWKDGIIDGRVEFRASQEQSKYSQTGKFCFTMQPPAERSNLYVRKRKMKRDIFVPPLACEGVIGIDPYDYRRVANQKTASQGSMVGGYALDFFDRGIKDLMMFSYLWRTKTPEEFFEDAIKALMYTGFVANVEAKNKNIIDYAEDRGYWDGLLPKDIMQPNSELKGNPASRPLTDEMCTLLDQYYADPYVLENTWDDNVLTDNGGFNPDDTQKSHLTMAQGHMLLGFQKLRLLARRKRRQPLTNAVQAQLAASISDLYFSS